MKEECKNQNILLGAIAGGIAEAYYGEVSELIKEEVLNGMPEEFIEVMQRFYQKFVAHEER